MIVYCFLFDTHGQVEVSLNPDELEGLDAATLKRKYENQMAAAKGTIGEVHMGNENL